MEVLIISSRLAMSGSPEAADHIAGCESCGRLVRELEKGEQASRPEQLDGAVRPAKAGVFNGSQSRQGKSQNRQDGSYRLPRKRPTLPAGKLFPDWYQIRFPL